MLDVNSYTIIAQWFPRLLGLIYFSTFFAFYFQINGLIGKNGILPINHLLKLVESRYGKRRWLVLPTLFWIHSSNLALQGLCVLGSFASILLLFGVVPPLMLFLLYLMYLSIVSVGQEFLGFGWEGFLLELTINAFLLSLTTIPNLMVWLSLNFLLFRFHFQAGIVKLQSKDPNWKNLTAISYHYQTQPLPNVVAWYFHKLPLWFHKVSCFLMFVFELAIPFGIFFGEDVRLAVFIALGGLQAFIWFTGNLSFLNHLTFLFCTILINNTVFGHFGITAPPTTEVNTGLEVLLNILGTLLLVLQISAFYHHFIPLKWFSFLQRYFHQFYIINRYGIFAVMTTKRYEIIIEGSYDGVEWKEYALPYKPAELDRRPRRISPFQPRVDWQAWFLPFSDFHSERWFEQFIYHLLKGTEDVLKLVRVNPFPEEPPKYIRAIAYDYVFSTFKEKRELGLWWTRSYAGIYSPTLSLKPK